MLFDFKLRPLHAVEPWGKEGDLSLSWFGFTDGYYRLNVGRDSLFTYSEATTQRLRAKYPDFDGQHVDYQVVRLWEDILEILPDILAPAPLRLAALLSGPEPQVARWLDQAEGWLRDLPDDQLDMDYERYCEAVTWLGNRHLDTGYLVSAPRIWIWSTPETVTVTWDNRDREIDGVAAWSAQCGTYTLSRDEFLREVQQFHESLIHQMAQRVEDIRANWNRPDVRVDFNQLRAEQAERAQAYHVALQRKPEPVDWSKVLEVVKQIDLRTGGTIKSFV